MLLQSSGIKNRQVNGNDIVDLKIATIPGGFKRSRFLDKIFSRDEQELICNGRVGVWAIWAMKEAVYKAHHRRFNLPRSFAPKGIRVHIREVSENSIKAEAEYLNYVYFGKGILTPDYIHFTATCFPKDQLYSEIHNTSVQIKNQLKQVISEKLGLEKEDLDIVKDKNYIPQLSYRNANLNLPFSISHHGNYAAFSFQLINY